jgi:hypothetical protein
MSTPSFPLDPDVLDPRRLIGRTLPGPLGANPASIPVTMPDPRAPQYQPLHGLSALGPVLSQFAGIPTKSGLQPLEGVRQLGQSALNAPQARYKEDVAAAETGQRMRQQEAQTEVEKERVELERAEAQRAEAQANKPDKPAAPTKLAPGEELVGPDGKVITSAPAKPEAAKALEKVTVVGPDGKPHVYGVDAQGNKKVDYGVEFQKPTDTADKDKARVDRSYQFNSTQLAKERSPLEAMMGKISTATTNVDLKSPQADALLAPEILSLAAGGAGSGLRMNEAEISRILGGRTAWESLQAAMNKYSTDPKHPQIPEAQRAQMVQILQAAQAKGIQKQQVLEWAESALVNADDAKSHRQIVQDARKFLDAVDDGKKIQRNKQTGELRIAPEQ